MKYVLAIVFSGLLLVAFQSRATGLSEMDRKKIESASKKWVEIYNQNNWQGLAELFLPEAIMMPPNSVQVQGREAIAAWEAENESGFRIAFEIQEIDGNNHMAYVRGRSCVFIPIADGEYGVDVGKFLEIRKKQTNGDWLIHTDIFNSDLASGGELLESCPFDTAQLNL